MSTRDYVVAQIEDLLESAVNKIIESISFRRFSLGLFDSDDDYLSSIPGMAESIKDGLAKPPSKCVPLSEVWADV